MIDGMRSTAIGAVLLLTSLAHGQWLGFDFEKTCQQNLIRLLSQPHIELSVPTCGDAYYWIPGDSEPTTHRANERASYLSGAITLFGAEYSFVAYFSHDYFGWFNLFAATFKDYENLYLNITGGVRQEDCFTAKLLDVNRFSIQCVLDVSSGFVLSSFITFDVTDRPEYSLMGLDIAYDY